MKSGKVKYAQPYPCLHKDVVSVTRTCGIQVTME
uniref:Uncharacterized protein n=1 Tax=Rhizophora mucronata TaxID=61149 RepID=A0A2P2QCZ9_RHIMU